MPFTSKEYQELLNLVDNYVSQRQKETEQPVVETAESKGDLGVFKTIKEVAKGIPYGFTMAGKDLLDVAESLHIARKTSPKFLFALGPLAPLAGLGLQPKKEEGEQDKVQKQLDTARQIIQEAEQYWKPQGLKEGSLPRYVYEGLAQATHMFPYLLGGEFGLPAMATSAGASHYVEKIKEKSDIDRFKVFRGAIETGLIEWATEKLPFEFMLKNLKPLVKLVAVTASDIPGEITANTLESLLYHYLYGDPLPDLKKQAIDTAIISLLTSGLLVGGSVTLENISKSIDNRRIQKRLDNIAKEVAKAQQGDIEATNKIAKELSDIIEDENVSEDEKDKLTDTVIDSVVKQLGVKDYIDKNILSPEKKTRKEFLQELQKDIESRLGPDIASTIKSSVMELGTEPTPEIEQLRQDILNRYLRERSPELETRIQQELAKQGKLDIVNKLQRSLLTTLRSLPQQERTKKLQLLALPKGQEFEIVPPELRRDLPVKSTAIPLEGEIQKEVKPKRKPKILTPEEKEKIYNRIELASFLDFGKFDIGKAQMIINNLVKKGYLTEQDGKEFLNRIEKLNTPVEEEDVTTTYVPQEEPIQTKEVVQSEPIQPQEQPALEQQFTPEEEQRYYEEGSKEAKIYTLQEKAKRFKEVRDYINSVGITPQSIDNYIGKGTPEAREIKKALQRMGFKALRKTGMPLDEFLQEAEEFFPDLGFTDKDIDRFIDFILYKYKTDKEIQQEIDSLKTDLEETRAKYKKGNKFEEYYKSIEESVLSNPYLGGDLRNRGDAIRLGHDIGYGLKGVDDKTLKDILQKSYGSLLVRATGLKPPIDAKEWQKAILDGFKKAKAEPAKPKAEEKPSPKPEEKEIKFEDLKEPNYENLKKGMILIDRSGSKVRVESITKEGVPAAWKIKIKDLDTGQEITYPTVGIERYYKILEGPKSTQEIKKGQIYINKEHPEWGEWEVVRKETKGTWIINNRNTEPKVVDEQELKQFYKLKQKEKEYVPSTVKGMESNIRERKTAKEQAYGTAIQSEQQRAREGAERIREGSREERVSKQGDHELRGRVAAPSGERSDITSYREDRASVDAERIARDIEQKGIDRVVEEREKLDSETNRTIEEPITREIERSVESVERTDQESFEEEIKRKREEQKKADKIDIKIGEPDNIKKTLPFLYEAQQSDVIKAEQRFFADKIPNAKQDDTNRGILFTNATGTGKTYTGLGIIKRFLRMGKENVIIVVPTDKKAKDWIEDAENLGIEVYQLKDTKDAGKGVVVTTYANFGQNKALFKRDWDLFVFDESHKLSENMKGDQTKPWEKFWALSANDKNGVATLLQEKFAKDLQKLKLNLPENALFNRAFDVVRAKIAGKHLEPTDVFEKLSKAIDKAQEAKAVFLSATPFAYHKNIRYADGFLFDSGENFYEGYTGYNQPTPWEDFLITKFGYRKKYNKLTIPESSVDLGIMEREFNKWLQEKRALSGRVLDIDKDYSRQFVEVPTEFGKAVQDTIDSIHAKDSKGNLKYPDFAEWFDKQFDYHKRLLLLEGLKAKAAIERVKQHLNLGRKVVVFHSRVSGEISNPFINLDDQIKKTISSDKLNKVLNQYYAWRKNNKHLIPKFKTIRNVIDEFKKAFPKEQIEFFNGKIPKKKRVEAVWKFNKDDSKTKIIVVQSDAGKEGISLHDTTGKHQRVLISLALPLRPVEAIQTEGRIYRLGVKSNAIIEYLKTGLPLEAFAFGSKINERAGTAENLALGYLARDLRTAFAEGYQFSTTESPSKNQGVGGKEADKRTAEESLFERAKSLYFANQKRTAKTKSYEGVDYFATPEPLGLKMVEWADIKAGEKVLEPSAGHGSIARFVPENVDLVAIEPSTELRAQLSVNTKGKVLDTTFENYHKVNKFDAILMNPPFGENSKTAFEHITKAFEHLRNDGRLIAIVPDGNSFWNRFDPWFSKNGKGFVIRAEIELPSNAFERAGTKVKTKILIIDKTDQDIGDTYKISIPEGKDINEFFDEIKDLTIVPRARLTLENKKQKLREYGLNVIEKGDRYYIKGSKTFDNKDFIKQTFKAKWDTFIRAWRINANKFSEEQIVNVLFEHVFNNKGLKENNEIKYLLTTKKKHEPITIENVQKIKEDFLKVYKNAPPINILRDEKELPWEVYADILMKNASGQVYGVYYKGEAYLIVNNMNSLREAAEALLHEAVGHHGLRVFYGDKLDSLLDKAWLNKRIKKEAESIAKNYGLDIRTIKERRIAIEEAIANLIQRGEKFTFLRKIKDYIKKLWRKFLTKIGYNLNPTMTDKELFSVIRKVHDFVKGYNSIVDVTGDKRNDIMYKLKETPDRFIFDQELDKQEKEFKNKQVKILLNLNDRKLLASFAKPHFLAKRWEGFRKAYERERMRVKQRQREMHELFEMVPTFIRLNKEEERQLAELVWSLDGKKIKGLPEKFIKGEQKEGPYYQSLNEKHYTKLYDVLREKTTLLEKVVKAYVEIRRALDTAQMRITNFLYDMKKKGLVEDSLIDQYLKEFGNIQNYFPHHRYGRYFVQAINKKGEVVYREHFDIPLEGLVANKKLKEKYIKSFLQKIVDRLNKDIKDKDIEWVAGENVGLPEEVYEYPIPVEAMEQIIMAAADRMKKVDPKVAKSVQEILPKAIADVIKTRGFGVHMIKRNNIPGFERENLKKVFFDYVTGYTGWKSKIEAARDYSNILREIKANYRPNEYAYTAQFIKDMLRNSDKIDELVNKFKTAAFVWYIGGVTATGILNLTQNIQVGIPRLSMETNKGTVFKYMKAAADTLIDATKKVIKGTELGSTLTEEERRMIKELYAEGVTTANYLREISGKLLGKNPLVGQVIDILGTTMSKPEIFNRVSIALAAFRMARNGDITNVKTLKHYGVDLKTRKFNYEQAKEFAADIVDDVHFVFEKANMPEIFRSTKGSRIASAAYTFRTFTHSLLSLWKWMLEYGPEGRKAFLKSLFAIMLLAGYKGLPFYKTISSIYKWLFGTDEEPIERTVKKLKNIKGGELLRDVIFYGIPSIAHISLQPSIAIESPGYDMFNPPNTLEERINRVLIDLLGIPYSLLVVKPSKALQSIKAGKYERALEYVLPRFISSVLRGYRETTEGTTTIGGIPISDLLALTKDEVKPLQPKGWDTVLRSLGFTTLDVQKNIDIRMSMNFAKTIRQEKLRELAQKALDKAKKGESISSVIKELKEWNTVMLKQNKPYMVIPMQTLIQSIRIRRKPIGLQKFERMFVKNY